jgi:hypothetical protein
MYLRLEGEMSQKLTDFLNQKRGEKMSHLRKPYSIRDMAKDLGILEGTMGRLMNHKVSVEGLDLDTFQALYRGFGDEFLEALGVDPAEPPTFLPVKEKDGA